MCLITLGYYSHVIVLDERIRPPPDKNPAAVALSSSEKCIAAVVQGEPARFGAEAAENERLLRTSQKCRAAP